MKHKLHHKIISIVLAVAMVLSMMPIASVAVSAAEGDTENPVIDFSVLDAYKITLGTDASGTYYQVNDSSSRIYHYTGNITFTGETTKCRISVTKGTYDVTFDNLYIDYAGNYSPIELYDYYSTVNLTLVGENTLDAGYGCAGLEVAWSRTLTIGGEGSLTATGGESAAGIGGSNGDDCGTVIINSGVVTANGGLYGAGIGGGCEGDGGDITINGGVVTANHGSYSAGIGGGYDMTDGDGPDGGDGGNVIITGGTVIAKGEDFAIGAGRWSTDGGTVEITGGNIQIVNGTNDISKSQPGTMTDGNGTNVSLNTIALNGVQDGTAIKEILTSTGTYGANDVQTIEDKLYLYLPSDTTPTQITLEDGTVYVAASNGGFYVQADSPIADITSGSITLSQDGETKFYTQNGATKIYTGIFTIAGNSAPSNTVTVESGTHDVVLDNISMVGGITVQANATANITLNGNNQLRGGLSNVGTVVITGDGALVETYDEYTILNQGTLTISGAPTIQSWYGYAIRNEVTLCVIGNPVFKPKTGYAMLCYAGGTIDISEVNCNGYTIRAVTDMAVSDIILPDAEYSLLDTDNLDVTAEVVNSNTTVKVRDPKTNVTIEADIPELTYDGEDKVSFLKNLITVKTEDGTELDPANYTLDISFFGNYADPVDIVRDAGYYEMVVKISDRDTEYSGMNTFEVYIAQKELTIVADDITINRGDTMPELTYNVYNGYYYDKSELPEEIYTGVMPVITLDTDGNSTSRDGTYKIKVSALDESGNYSIFYLNGTLTVTCLNHVFSSEGFCTSCDGYQNAALCDNGTPDEEWDDYYEIRNAGQLYWFADFVNNVEGASSANAKLMDDIQINPNHTFNSDGTYTGDGEPRTWVPIGTSADGSYLVYTGTFDGNEKTISGLYINNPEQSYVGLFGRIGYNPEIKDIRIANSYFSGNENVGAIAGYAEVYLSASSAASTVTVKGNFNVGGLIGSAGAYGDVYNCFSAATVDCAYGGGLVGYSCASIRNCYTTGQNVAYNINSSYGASFTNAYYLNEADDGYAGTTAVSAEQFASGEIAYLLQEGVAPVDVYDDDWNYIGSETPHVWGQNIDNDGEKQLYPVFDGAKVYKNQIGGCCETNIIYGYSNAVAAPVNTHVYVDNGICICGAYEVPTQDADGYYLIANAGNLYWFAQQVNDADNSISGKLIADIVLPDPTEEGTSNWTPIGNESISFQGEFDGQDHAVANIQIHTTEDYQGLFGSINKHSTVKNVGVIESNINGEYYVGGVCGENYGGTITNCYNTGMVAGRNQVGGVCGYSGGTINNCYNTGTVKGSYSHVGGVCGYSGGTINNCYNTGTVTGSNKNVGGVCGNNLPYATITNCYNIGTVTGGTDVGGVCGYNRGTITNCYYNSTILTGNAVGLDEGTTDTEGKSTEVFESGEVAYLLNNGVTDGTQAWYQTVGTGVPVLDSDAGTVYVTIACDKETVLNYNNTSDATGTHDYQNGICSICGAYEEPTQDEDDYYLIANAGNLYWFAQQVNDADNSISGKLIADIVLPDSTDEEPSNWTPIGKLSFQGEFDGQGHTVANIQIYTTEDYQGLFGCVIYSSVKNVGVIESIINGGWHVGGVCGASYDSTIENCYNTGVVNGSRHVGGVCGYNDGSTIENCYNVGAVSGSDYYVGGVCGYNTGTDGIITNCYNTGAVNGSNNYVGGVCGYNATAGTVVNCYNTGAVNGKSYVGGVCGYNAGTDGIITNCYNTGTVEGSGTGSANVGGVCGYNGGIITNCYNAEMVKGIYSVGGVCGYNHTGATIENCYNVGAVSASSYYVGGVCARNNGTITNCYYNNETFIGNAVDAGEGSATGTEGKTTEAFASGEVAYLLQGNQTEQVWGQNIDNDGEKQLYPVLDGDKVYYNQTRKCTETDYTYAYSNTEAVSDIIHNYDINGKCSDCGDQLPAVLSYYTLSLNGNIAVNYYMSLSDVVPADENAYMQFTMANGKVIQIPVSEAKQVVVDGNTYYVFSAQVAAKEMTDEIKSQFFYTDGATEEYTYSVKQYADYILADTTGAYTQEVKDLVTAMLNYGAYAQIHFGYNTDNLAADLEAADLSGVTAETLQDFANTDTQGTDLASFYGSSLILESETTLRFFFRVDETVENFTVTHNGVALEVKERSGFYYVDVTNISAKDLDKDITVTVNDGTDSAEVVYNPMTYCYNVLAAEEGTYGQDLLDVVRALYLYNQAANVYLED